MQTKLEQNDKNWDESECKQCIIAGVTKKAETLSQLCLPRPRPRLVILIAIILLYCIITNSTKQLIIFIVWFCWESIPPHGRPGGGFYESAMSWHSQDKTGTKIGHKHTNIHHLSEYVYRSSTREESSECIVPLCVTNLYLYKIHIYGSLCL